MSLFLWGCGDRFGFVDPEDMCLVPFQQVTERLTRRIAPYIDYIKSYQNLPVESNTIKHLLPKIIPSTTANLNMQYFSHLLAGLTLLAFTATALPLQDRGLSIEDRAPIEERGTPSENLDKGFSNHIAIQHQQKQDLKGIAATESMKGQTNQNFDGAKNKLINTIEKGVDVSPHFPYPSKRQQHLHAFLGWIWQGLGK